MDPLLLGTHLRRCVDLPGISACLLMKVLQGSLDYEVDSDEEWEEEEPGESLSSSEVRGHSNSKCWC